MKLIGYTTESDFIVSLTFTDLTVLHELLKKHQLKNNAIHQVLLEDFDGILNELEESDGPDDSGENS